MHILTDTFTFTSIVTYYSKYFRLNKGRKIPRLSSVGKLGQWSYSASVPRAARSWARTASCRTASVATDHTPASTCTLQGDATSWV